MQLCVSVYVCVCACMHVCVLERRGGGEKYTYTERNISFVDTLYCYVSLF